MISKSVILLALLFLLLLILHYFSPFLFDLAAVKGHSTASFIQTLYKYINTSYTVFFFIKGYVLPTICYTPRMIVPSVPVVDNRKNPTGMALIGPMIYCLSCCEKAFILDLQDSNMSFYFHFYETFHAFKCSDCSLS